MSFLEMLSTTSIDSGFHDDLRRVPEKQLDNLGVTKIDFFKFNKEYFKKRVPDASIDPNSNITGRSPNNYYLEQEKSKEALLCFEELFKMGKKHFDDFSLDYFYDGRLYFHDKTKYKLPYCLGMTTTNILLFGKPFGVLKSKPAKRLHSFMEQVKAIIKIDSQQNAGAIAPTDLPVTMAYMLKNESDKEIENYYQSFVHEMNDEFRIGGDSPFTNVMLSAFGPYERMFEDYVFPDGRTIYDLHDKIKRINGIIMDFMMKGDPDRNGMPYKFPVHTLQVTKDDVNTEMFEDFARRNALGYFNVNQTEQFSMCCRFMPDDDTVFRTGYFGGGGGMQLGSHRVVTINMPAVGYEHVTTGRPVMEIMEETLKNAVQALVIHKLILKKYIELDFLQLFTIGWIWMHQLYSTIGLHGWPEFLNIIGKNFDDIKFTTMIIRWMRNALQQYGTIFSEEFNIPIKFNVEEVPAEGSTGTMARFNQMKYGVGDVYYSNQFVPLYADIPLHERLNIESDMCSSLTGGSMTFINLMDQMDEDSSLKMHSRIIRNTDIPQFCFNYGWSTCKCSNEIGFREYCDNGHKMKHWTRIVGFLTCVEDTWPTVRQLELVDRIWN